MDRRSFLASLPALTTLAGCSAAGTGVRARSRFDVLITGCQVLDGSGSPAFRADVGIRDGLIAAVGRLDGATAERTIRADGLIAAPGFIDIHSHVDLSLFKDPRAPSKVCQGVTTEVTGADGFSPAPLGGPGLEQQLEDFRAFLGFECPYRTMDGFFSALERNGCTPNLISLVGLGTLRETVIGYENRPATAEELKRMQELVRGSIEEGCFGTSSGLEYTPGSFASTEELAALVGSAPVHRRLYATHLRNEDNTLLEAIDEAIAICRRSGGRLLVSHLKASYRKNWHKQRPAIDMLETAAQSGMDVHADRYPYVAYATDLEALFPLWAREGGRAGFLRRLGDPSLEGRLMAEVSRKIFGLGSWESIMITNARSEASRKRLGRTLHDIAAEMGVDPYRAAVRILQEESGSVGMVGFGMSEEGTEDVYRWPRSIVASDAGAYSPESPSRPHPRAYGTFPRAIAVYQRERGVCSLPEMVHKMTGLPARVLGLRSRGILAENMAADIVIFDEAGIRDRATYLEPHQYPEGIPWVMINGVPVVENGRQNSMTPGVVIRSGGSLA